ncbi:MAG: CHASE2 domain-containing protein [Cyanobium sp.]
MAQPARRALRSFSDRVASAVRAQRERLGWTGPLRALPLLRALAPYGVAGLLLLALHRTGVAESLNLRLYDLITTRRPAPSARSLPIAIVGMSEGDIGHYGWPVDDSVFCAVIDRLLRDGALAVGLDIYRDRGVGQEQQCLRTRFQREPRLVSIFNAAEGIRAIPGTPPTRQAFNDLVLDPDGVLRRDLVHVSGQDEATVSFPLRLLEVGSGSTVLRRQLEAGTAPGPWLEPGSGGYDRLEAGGYQQMFVFRRPGSFSTWSLRDVMTPGRVPPSAFRGRVVLIGSTAPSLRDVFEVPQSQFTTGSSQPMVPGVELHAMRLAALRDRLLGDGSLRIRTLPPWQEQAIALMAVSLAVVLGESFHHLRRSILAVSTVTLLLAATGVVLLDVGRVWIDLSMPLMGLMLMGSAAWLRRGAASQQQRQQFEKLLGQTTSPAVARQLWSQRESLLSDGRFEGRQLPVTVVFSDLVGFTTVSEGLSPRDLLAWLNRAMAVFVPAITERGGMVNKFTGDGFLAVFGAPMSEGVEVDAGAAIDAALEFQARLPDLNRALEAEGWPTLRMRVGIHSGEVLAGSMGSSERVEYALIGDTVNCASRLESLARERHDNLCRVLVSANTHSLLAERGDLIWQAWGPMQVKGREEPLEIWELRGQHACPGSAGPDQRQGLEV